jgi:hypothetical protein
MLKSLIFSLRVLPMQTVSEKAIKHFRSLLLALGLLLH